MALPWNEDEASPRGCIAVKGYGVVLSVPDEVPKLQLLAGLDVGSQLGSDSHNSDVTEKSFDPTPRHRKTKFQTLQPWVGPDAHQLSRWGLQHIPNGVYMCHSVLHCSSGIFGAEERALAVLLSLRMMSCVLVRKESIFSLSSVGI